MRVILVPVADRPECARALSAAFAIAGRIDASVSGCHMRPHRYSDTRLSPAFAEAAWRKKSTKKAPAAAKALYEQIANDADFVLKKRAGREPGALWSEKVGSPDRLMAIVGPLADLIVTSRPERTGGVADMFLNAALLQSGRPVLILPKAARRNVGTRICIGWNQTSEAARSVAAVTPLLAAAESVTIVSCGAEDQPGPKSTQLAQYLRHYGVTAERINTPGRDVEGELATTCREQGANLLVAGAYSKSRWREKVFGGTTEWLIHECRLPVLLQHS
ncbi:MAG: universal stress protein [Pseudomonadota bacterium]